MIKEQNDKGFKSCPWACSELGNQLGKSKTCQRLWGNGDLRRVA